MYDVDFLDSCAGEFWCMYVGANTMVDGLLSVGLLVFMFFAVFFISNMRNPEQFLDNGIVSLFAVLVIGFILFLGSALMWQILLVVLLLLGMALIIKQISK